MERSISTIGGRDRLVARSDCFWEDSDEPWMRFHERGWLAEIICLMVMVWIHRHKGDIRGWGGAICGYPKCSGLGG